MGTTQSSSNQNHNTLNKSQSQLQNRLLKKNSSSLHLLHPKTIQSSIDYIQRKWKYKNKQDAQEKYKKLMKKLSPSQKLITIKNVQIIGSGDNTSRGNIQQCYIVRAKIQYPRHNLLEELKYKKNNYLKFTERQLLNILIGICESTLQLKHKNITYIPTVLSQIFYQKCKVKLRDPELIPALKTELIDYKVTQFSQKICKLIISLYLLCQKQQILFQDIIKFNLENSTSFSALLYRMNQQNMQIQTILSSSRKIKAQKMLVQQNLKIFKKQFCNRKNSHNNLLMAPGTQIKNQQIEKQKYYYRSASENYICQPDRLLNNCQSQHIIKGLFDDKQNLLRTINIAEQNQKSIKQFNSHKRHNSTKTSIQIDQHQFPKNIKPFRRSSSNPYESNSAKQSLLSQEQNIKKQQLQAAFLKLTNGTSININKVNQQVLESVGEEDQSMVIRQDDSSGNESPVVNLETQLQDQQQCEKFENYALSQEQENHSDLQINVHHNSTIMEVTEEDQSVDKSYLEVHNSYKRQSDLDNYSIISKKSMNEYNCSSSERLSFERAHENQEYIGQDNQRQFAIEEYEGGSRYQGYVDRKNRLKNGFGKLYYEDGGSYEGAWVNGEIDGYGKLYYQSGNLAYEGYWVKGQFDGQGKIINQAPQPLVQGFNYQNLDDIGTSWQWYQGVFSGDQKCGNGTLMLVDGSKFIGFWKNNQINGDGQFISPEGKITKGRWQGNILIEEYSQQ